MEIVPSYVPLFPAEAVISYAVFTDTVFRFSIVLGLPFVGDDVNTVYAGSQMPSAKVLFDTCLILLSERPFTESG